MFPAPEETVESSGFRITAAIPVYNGEPFLADAIESVLAQTFPPSEVLVIDDGSTDGSAEVVRGYPGVRYVRQENRGDAGARNAAIEHAQGDYIAFLDADDVWKPRKLELQVQRFLSRPDLGMVYAGVEVVRRDLSVVEILRPAPGDVALKNTLLVEKPYMTGVGSSALLPLRVAKEVRFDERLRASADWAFACGVAARYPVDRVDEPLVQYRQHEGAQVHNNLEAVERDMELVWAEMFSGDLVSGDLKRGYRRARANLQLSLAASSFKQGDRGGFASHLVKALWLRPDRVVAALWRRYMVPPS
jgi:glycosyltransferase involved in cell wall biosynthesis